MKPVRFIFSLTMIIALLLGILSSAPPEAPAASNEWRITSVKVCRDRGGSLFPHVTVIGSYPVYSFFLPRPVWTINGSVVDAQPVYDRGRLIEFTLIGATEYLKAGAKNTIKFSLPDQNGAKVFFFNEPKVVAGECFEFF